MPLSTSHPAQPSLTKNSDFGFWMDSLWSGDCGRASLGFWKRWRRAMFGIWKDGGWWGETGGGGGGESSLAWRSFLLRIWATENRRRVQASKNPSLNINLYPNTFDKQDSRRPVILLHLLASSRPINTPESSKPESGCVLCPESGERATSNLGINVPLPLALSLLRSSSVLGVCWTGEEKTGERRRGGVCGWGDDLAGFGQGEVGRSGSGSQSGRSSRGVKQGAEWAGALRMRLSCAVDMDAKTGDEEPMKAEQLLCSRFSSKCGLPVAGTDFKLKFRCGDQPLNGCHSGQPTYLAAHRLFSSSTGLDLMICLNFKLQTLTLGFDLNIKFPRTSRKLVWVEERIHQLAVVAALAALFAYCTPWLLLFLYLTSFDSTVHADQAAGAAGDDYIIWPINRIPEIPKVKSFSHPNLPS
ncbi:hypothetical protein GALMADRAFT_274816 [Galerina marginata CBS 339.88]|uniref:Uncharacterized protein n=1 Tax=Galerina marginata (strain CBS 339.88) TaxID=685588 RepID=A0A067TSF3_GALM3|nr:hypothetical protein GALMADRAFT_274816 [Galerina marginata CBS 339.88]